MTIKFQGVDEDTGEKVDAVTEFQKEKLEKAMQEVDAELQEKKAKLEKAMKSDDMRDDDNFQKAMQDSIEEARGKLQKQFDDDDDDIKLFRIAFELKDGTTASARQFIFPNRDAAVWVRERLARLFDLERLTSFPPSSGR